MDGRHLIHLLLLINHRERSHNQEPDPEKALKRLKTWRSLSAQSQSKNHRTSCGHYTPTPLSQPKYPIDRKLEGVVGCD